jgi:two-component system cell cycle sensor histidine kinase/response regulator CckA
MKPLETILKKKDGTTFQAELSSRKVWFRGNEAIQSFIRDVSVRKVLEESLRESKEKYRLLVESSLVGVFIIRQGLIQFVNSKFAEFLGCTKEDLIEKDFFEFIAPEDRGMVKNRENQREKGMDVPDHYEVRFIRSENEKRYGEIRSCRIEIGGEAAVLGNIVDITQRKKLEMQLFESHKMESIGTLAGGIAHDFNNLLGGILGYASLLLSDMPENHIYYNDIHTIAETAKRAADLTNRLLAFARGGKYHVRSIDLNQIVEDVIAILSRSINKSISIETYIGKNLWWVKGDSQQIHQAVMNVCLNAADAMSGGGKLKIRTANVILDENFSKTQLGVQPGDYIRITISDTGVGMDEKTKNRIFEPFFTTKPAGEGTGLGLAMVYGIVKNHEGAILVDSEIGRGTKVSILLPRFQEVKEETEISPVPQSSPENKILLVDDEEVIRQVGKRMLEKGGYGVLLASNGKEALNIYQKRQKDIDLVILDLIMPEMGGKETFKRLREMDNNLKVIFTSGYGPYNQHDLKQFGNAIFIQKPFQTEVLLQSIRKML